jgi:hypothetical protein
MNLPVLCLICLLVTFYVGGFLLLGTTLRGAGRSMQVAAWPTTPATLTNLDLPEYADDDGTTYAVEARYTYTVGGVAYEGSRLAFGYVASSGRVGHDEIYRRLKEAKAVAVRYDPSDPAESCLSFGLHRSIQIQFVFSVTWLLLTIGFTLLFWLFSRSDRVLLDNLAVQ